jgi:hypothetical protein
VENCLDGCANLNRERVERVRSEVEVWDGINRIANYTQALGLDVAVIRSRVSQFVAVQVVFIVFQMTLVLMVACK